MAPDACVLWFSVSAAFIAEALSELSFAGGKAVLTDPLMCLNRNSIMTWSLLGNQTLNADCQG